MKDTLTIVMPTSPIPSHPSTEVVEESIRRLRAYPDLKDCEILIQIDGIREEQRHREADYEEYKRRLLWLCAHEFENCLPIVFDEHLHQAGMLRATLDRIRTPLLFYVEHDTFPMGEIDFPAICRAVVNHPNAVKQVRMHIYDSVLQEHEYLMLDKEPHVIEGAPMIRTIQQSQRPHISSVVYYRWILETYIGKDAKTMIEDFLYPIGYHQYIDGLIPHEHFGFWIYCPHGTQTDMLRSGTTDGRREEKKYRMHFSYDGEPPIGAPVNRH